MAWNWRKIFNFGAKAVEAAAPFVALKNPTLGAEMKVAGGLIEKVTETTVETPDGTTVKTVTTETKAEDPTAGIHPNTSVVTRYPEGTSVTYTKAEEPKK